jgi:C1A family cysteine protease
VIGGHAVLCLGYDNASQTFLCQNSWGKGWGMQGFFTMPYAYLTNPDLAGDFWSIRMV